MIVHFQDSMVNMTNTFPHINPAQTANIKYEIFSKKHKKQAQYLIADAFCNRTEPLCTSLRIDIDSFIYFTDYIVDFAIKDQNSIIAIDENHRQSDKSHPIVGVIVNCDCYNEIDELWLQKLFSKNEG